jgi:hypothetical protein
VLGVGTQNVYIDGGRPAAVAVSVAPPFGQRDEAKPVRGREGVLADLAPGRLSAAMDAGHRQRG